MASKTKKTNNIEDIMGYSCSTKASLTLEAIELLSEFDEISDNYKYFFEIGQENSDGAITGKVYELIGQSYEGNDGLMRRPCKVKGSFKIGADGFIVRFPGLEKFLWPIPHNAMIEQYDKMISLLYA